MGGGGQFERLLVMMKTIFYKTVGGGRLTWEELSEVLIDTEISMNNRPLCYVEDDVQLPLLTPNSILFLNANYMPELKTHVGEVNLRKRAKCLKRVKNEIWKPWTNEYCELQENVIDSKHSSKANHINRGDIFLIKTDIRNRNKWPIRIVVI